MNHTSAIYLNPTPLPRNNTIAATVLQAASAAVGQDCNISEFSHRVFLFFIFPSLLLSYTSLTSHQMKVSNAPPPKKCYVHTRARAHTHTQTWQWNVCCFFASVHDYEMLPCLWPNSSCWKMSDCAVPPPRLVGWSCAYANCRCLAALCSFIQPQVPRRGAVTWSWCKTTANHL